MNASRWAVSAALCASLGFSGNASAADEGWYIVGFAGESSVNNVQQGELDQNLIDAFGTVGLTVVDATSDLDDSDTGFGIAGGYQVNPWFAAELAYVDLGDIAYDASGTVTDGISTFDADFGLEQSAAGPVFSLLGIWPIGERFSVFGRLGIALMSVDADVDVTIDGESAADSVSTDRSNLMYGVGGEYLFNERFGVRLGWDRYAEVGSEDLTGDTDYDLVTLGLRYNFD
ncbi:MAG TPA: outer membrane beta-barrel protein [Steroidobacteraceae bacterium]|nr:outer membrane beta-barrel protein [Steroidobacteraceae bacterium]